MLIYPQIYPHFAQVKIFSLSHVCDARIPKVQILHVQILQVGDCMGLMFQTGLLWGCFAIRLVPGSGRQAVTAGGAGCVQVLPENPCLTRSDFQESCRLTLSNIPKRALGYLECARIAFIWSGNDM